MIGLIDMFRGLVELIIQAANLVALRRDEAERPGKSGRPPKLETRREQNVDRIDAWLRFRGVSGRTHRKEPRL